ncbi:MAG: N-acetyl-gamma-glutamyl-phosphate reductase [Clostridia bacterium]|nr:N-acetyl-gamma-glutamyl-phosphate reductase [Clostridia bacterium]
MKIRVGIVGATGYAGAELVRLILTHPAAELVAISSVSFEGKKISEVYPNLAKVCEMELTDAAKMAETCDVVFAALPHGLSEPLAAECAKTGAILIDLGADFRLEDEADYQKWYQKSYICPELHQDAVYCIPELHRAAVSQQKIIANPGCYPTSIALGLAPALKGELIETAGIVIDSKSGVTGAGRGLTQGTHYPDTNEAFAAYKAGVHRHTPEIEQTLSHLAGKAMQITFVPHLLPINRGIESSIYCKMKTDLATIHAAYCDFYKDEPFVRVLPLGSYANVKNVRMSNYCDISLHADERTGTLIISSVIDNMFKGAAGQAIQNMNLRMGLAETCGIDMIPPAI